MPFFDRTISKRFKIPYHGQPKYTPQNMNPEYLPPQIVPRRPVASLLNHMAYRTSQKYDKSPKPSSSLNESTPMINNVTNNPKVNSDVLFFPGQNNIACAGKVASSGKINI